MIGIALIVKARTVDNLMIQKAIDMTKPGDVVVITAKGDKHSAILEKLWH